MKSNLISAIAGWKSAALLALVAMVAAVAFSGVLTNSESANAQTQTTSVDSEPGKTVTITFTNVDSPAGDRYRIHTDSEGSATFAFNGGTAMTCANDAANGCDAAKDDLSGTPAVAANTVAVRVTVDEDSPLGEIYVQRYSRDGTAATPIDVHAEATIVVKRPNPPVALRAANVVTPAATANPAATDPGVTIKVKLVDARGNGLPSTNLLVTTTRGAFNGALGGADGATAVNTVAGSACDGVSACTIATTVAFPDPDGDSATDDGVDAGFVTVRLKGNGATGPAEVTFRELATGLSHTATVVLHGPAASISAAADQSTIGLDGSTFIVVTVSDAEGNPVVGVTDVAPRSNKPLVPAIVGPEVPAGSSANLVAAVTAAADVINRDLPGVVNDVPSCTVHDRAAVAADPAATPPVEASAASASTGTNVAGKCVIQVTAPSNGPGPADDTTRGTHTVTIGTADVRIATVNVEIQVGGAPASIETDAPARVDSLSSTKITVTVLDDEGVRVGAVPISVVQVEGSGNADDVGGNMTSDGRGSFTFLAPLTPGEAVFLIRAGNAAAGQQIQDTVTLAIGPEPVVEEAPEAPPATWNNELVSGQNLVVWNGADGADPSEGAADGVSAIWAYNAGAGTWDGYFPSAADVPGGNTLTSLGSGQAYVVIVE